MDAENIIHENIFQELIYQFCIDNNINDMRTASQAVWNSCLRFLYRKVFKDTNLLKTTELNQNHNQVAPSNDNAYNPFLVLELLDVYIYDMCLKYDKEVSILGFSSFSGIDDNTFYAWGNCSGRDELSQARSDVFKKLHRFREESLSNKLATGNKNPVGILAILNRHYQWNLPGVSREQGTQRALTADQLPKLGQTSPAALSDQVIEQ